MTETALPYSPPQQGTDKKKNKNILIVIVIAVAVLIAAVFVFRQPKKIEQTKGVSVENKQPSPTKRPEIDKKTVKIQVINGTGIPGQAGKVVDVLKEAGYESDNIETDNAQDFATQPTLITAKEGFEDIALDIKDNLDSSFEKIDIDTKSLSKDNAFDIIVTTGGKKYEETTPTPKPTETGSNPSATPTPTPTNTPTP